MFVSRIQIVCGVLAATVVASLGLLGAPPSAALPDVPKRAASRQDIWGEAAVRQPGGPSYEFFQDLLPPLRYVNTDFRQYPVVLGTPAGSIILSLRPGSA